MFYVLIGAKQPIFLEDEEGQAFAFETIEQAQEAMKHNMLCQAWSCFVLEWDDEDGGLIEVHD